jgi:hypothetical protein
MNLRFQIQRSVKSVMFAAIIVESLFSGSAHSQNVVKIQDLLSSPVAWNNKHVSVIGYYQIDSAGHSSRLLEKKASDASGDPSIFVDLGRGVSDAAAREAANHWVKISGTFQYKDISETKTLPQKDPTARQLVERPQGFGWMGIYDKQLTKIKKFEVVARR